MGAKVIAVVQQKGGVGKTTTAVSLGHGLAVKGCEVMIIDLDPQGNVAKALDLEKDQCVYEMVSNGRIDPGMVKKARERLFIIPGNEETAYAQIMMSVRNKGRNYLAKIIQPLRRNGPDYIIFDTSPSVGGLQERAIYAADLVIIPTITDYMSADSVAETMETISEYTAGGWKGGALVLPTFFDERTNHAKETLASLHEIYNGQVCEPIHYATVLKEAAADGKTIWEMDGTSRAAEEYAALLYKIMELK
jgi:chromosome partitioning protein